MSAVLLVALFIFLTFAFVVAFGAPYLPTLHKQAQDSLDLLDLKEGQTLLELGCGDGRVLKAAARRGIISVGYEINPILVIIAKINTIKYRSKVKIIWGNYWNAEWPKSDGMYVFLLDKYMDKLNKKIIQYNLKKVPYKLVSYGFKIKSKKPKKQIKGLNLYVYTT